MLWALAAAAAQVTDGDSFRLLPGTSGSVLPGRADQGPHVFSPEPTLSETGSPWQAIVESSHIRGLGPKPPLKDYISWVDTSIKAPAIGSATGVITGFNKVEVLVRSSDGSQFEPAKEVYLHHAIMYQSRNAVTVMLNHKRERLDSLLDLCNSHFLMRTGNDGNVPLDYPRGTGSYVEGYQALRWRGAA